ncbi:MAG TPA: hypothetical protein VGY14_05990 [Methyloceanibacter sp.]|nr:hypothetical protein [Methyloceanibacter sp.]
MKLTRTQVILAVLGPIALQAAILLAMGRVPSANAAMSSCGTAW